MRRGRRDRCILLSEAGSGITGETIFVDCGYNIMGF